MQHNLLTYENVNVYLMLVFSILYYAMLWDIWKHIFILICHCCNFIYRNSSDCTMAQWVRD